MSELHHEAQVLHGVYEVLSKIGEGGYGNVHLVLHKSDKKKYSITIFFSSPKWIYFF